jgi:hypothetical protein
MAIVYEEASPGSEAIQASFNPRIAPRVCTATTRTGYGLYGLYGRYGLRSLDSKDPSA